MSMKWNNSEKWIENKGGKKPTFTSIHLGLCEWCKFPNIKNYILFFFWGCLLQLILCVNFPGPQDAQIDGWKLILCESAKVFLEKRSIWIGRIE